MVAVSIPGLKGIDRVSARLGEFYGFFKMYFPLNVIYFNFWVAVKPEYGEREGVGYEFPHFLTVPSGM